MWDSGGGGGGVGSRAGVWGSGVGQTCKVCVNVWECMWGRGGRVIWEEQMHKTHRGKKLGVGVGECKCGG